MDPLLYARAVERVIVCIFGGVSMILGWNLFRAGVLTDQTASVTFQKLSAKIERAGPGVFFALFGAAILVYALRSPLSVSGATQISPAVAQEKVGPQTASPGVGSSSSYKSSYLGGERGDAREFAQAVNTVELLVGPKQLAGLSPAESAAFERARTVLTDARDSLVGDRFGYDSLETFRAKYSASVAGKSLPRSDRQVVEQLEPWLKDTLVLAAPKGTK